MVETFSNPNVGMIADEMGKISSKNKTPLAEIASDAYSGGGIRTRSDENLTDDFVVSL